MRTLGIVWRVGLTLLLLTLGLAVGDRRVAEPIFPTHNAPFPLIVLAASDDPYHGLAEEIAAAEGAGLISSHSELPARGPVFLLWVASPSYLSSERLVDFSRFLGARMKEPDGVVVPGIISGGSVSRARALWERRGETSGRIAAAVIGANPSANLPASITLLQETQVITLPYAEASVLRALRETGYLTYEGHGAPGAFLLGEGVRLDDHELPSLGPVVVATGACNTFRPAEGGALPLAFTDRGAAAYAGFVFSPNAGYLVGGYGGLPFRYTSPDFPVGMALLLQTRGTLLGFAAFPYYLLLGDPRLALTDAVPYRLVRDEEAGRTRRLRFTDLPAGAVPLRVPGGAGYDYVEVAGVTASARRDFFYNARLQSLDAGADKYLLIVSEGGELEVRLRRHPPLGWTLADALLDALDHTLIFLQQPAGGGVAILLAVAGGLGLVAALVILRRPPLRERVTGRRALLALTGGLIAAALHGVYVLARVDVATVTSKPLVFVPLMVVPTCVLVGQGAFLYLVSGSLRGKGVALIVATSNAWIAGLFTLGATQGFNLLFFHPRMGGRLYNVAPALMAFIATAFLALLWWALYALLSWESPRPEGHRYASGGEYQRAV